MNQRYSQISFTRKTGSLTLSAPSKKNNVPPGHYLVFILNAAGIPSVARIIHIG